MSEYKEYVCRFYPDSWGEKSITLFGVPIVRCRDCIYLDVDGYCTLLEFIHGDISNKFCAWGERRQP